MIALMLAYQPKIPEIFRNEQTKVCGDTQFLFMYKTVYSTGKYPSQLALSFSRYLRTYGRRYLQSIQGRV